jgi:hypothetical protein
VRWLFVLATACGATHSPLDATPVVEGRGTITAMTLGDGTLYWATSGYLSVNVIWAMPYDAPRIHGSTSLQVTSMAAVYGNLFIAGDGGTTMIGADGPMMVRRSEGTRVDVLEPHALSIRAVYIVDEHDAVAVGDGRVAIGARTYALADGALVEYDVEQPEAVLPTPRGLAYVHDAGLYENERRLGDVGDVRWLAERGDELWAIGVDEVSVWRAGTLETAAAPGPIRAIASDGDELYLASGPTIWRVE